MVIVLGGLIGSLGYNANSGILQGLGDSKTPLLFLVIACIINIVLDLLFVVVFHWGVAGVAIATIIAQAFSWIFGIFYINKKYPQIHIHPFCFKFDKALFGQIVKLGVPAGVQQALFSFGVMAMQRLINSYGSAFMAGFNGANKLDTFAFMPIQSFATAATTFVGQNIGANRPERVHKGTVATLWMSCGFSVLVAVLLLPTGRFCMRLFSTEPAVIESGFAYLARILPFYWMLAIMFVLSSIMRGAGEMMVPMISSLAALWLARVPAAYLLAAFFRADEHPFLLRHRLGAGAGHLRAVLFLRPLERKKHCRARGRRKLNTKKRLERDLQKSCSGRAFFACCYFRRSARTKGGSTRGSTRSLYFSGRRYALPCASHSR